MAKDVIARQSPDTRGIGVGFQTDTAFRIGVFIAPMHFRGTQHFHPRMGWVFFKFNLNLGLFFIGSLKTVFDRTNQ
jgi:hypothetical protein